MRLRRLNAFLVLLFCLLSASCGPGLSLNTASSPTAPPPITPVIPDTGLFAGQSPSSGGKPVMALGSAYRYFDGSLLDAVPDNGPFLMGATNSSGDNPQHKISVSSFWIYSTEVSNQMYAWCVSLGKCTPPDSRDNPLFQASTALNNPVVGVTWQQAADYCSFAHGRLPTEAEWEKAASWDGANALHLLFPWGSEAPDCTLLNFKYCVGHATSVVQYGQGRSFYGTYNMEGNVSEWVGDWYAADYYAGSPSQDPAGPSSGSARVIRGSAFDSDAIYAPPTARMDAPPSVHRNDLGFRCVVKDPSYYAPFCTVPASFGFSAFVPGSDSLCPGPSIQHLEGCTQDSQPLDFVTVLSSGQTSVTVSGLEGCTPATNDVGVQHTCPSGVTIRVSATCGANPPGSPACPPNYQQDPGNPLKCTASGAPGACPAGFSYDSSLQCCTVSSRNPAIQPLCSAGQRPFEGKCVDDSTGPQAPASLIYVTGGIACTLIGSPGHLVPVPTIVPPPPGPPPGHGGGHGHPGGPPGGGKCHGHKHGCGPGGEGLLQLLQNFLALF